MKLYHLSNLEFKGEYLEKDADVFNYGTMPYIFFISNLGFCPELGLLNSETKIGTGVA